MLQDKEKEMKSGLLDAELPGMDPAGPYFQWMPTFVRLDPSDATLVDIIHSNGVANFALGGWGSSQPMGHLDFYPNGGAHQPGCPAVELPAGLSIDDIVDFGTGLVACSHSRAVDLFTESLRSPVRPVAYECPSYHDFEQVSLLSLVQLLVARFPTGPPAN